MKEQNQEVEFAPIDRAALGLDNTRTDLFDGLSEAPEQMFENVPMLKAGKPGFDLETPVVGGKVITGYDLLRQKKKTRTSVKIDGNYYLERIVLETATAAKVAVIVAGNLRGRAKCLLADDVIRLTYLGTENNNEADPDEFEHVFKIEAKAANGKPIDFGARWEPIGKHAVAKALARYAPASTEATTAGPTAVQ